MINTNTLLVSLFSPAQIVAMVLVAVLLALLISLNLYMMYLNHKRGEHKMHTKQLQQQRDALMDKLAALRAGTYVSEPESVEDNTESTEDEADKNQAVLLGEESDEAESFSNDTDDDDQDSEIEIDETGNIIRYSRSFTARIIQSSDEVKARYSELKNYLLSFENVRSRISWKHEIFQMGKKTVGKFNVRGKTLCLCLATDPKMFDGTKYVVDDLSVRNKKNPMPCLYRIKSELRVRYAKDLIDVVMAGFEAVQKDSYEESNFVMPYESTQVLIKRKLIKLAGNDLEEAEREEAIAASKGIRYDRSFEAQLLQADTLLKTNYTKLKNYLLGHGGVSVQMSWKQESFRRGKTAVADLLIRGKAICLCLVGNVKNLEGKFKVEDNSIKNPNTDLPVLYRIQNSHQLSVALQLIDRVFGDLGIGKIQRIEETYPLDHASTEELVNRWLIKVEQDEKVEEAVKTPDSEQSEVSEKTE